MGSLSDNGGDSDDLPDLPEEWGVIVIPDDLSELADEVEAVRAELAFTAPRTRYERFRARPAVRRIRRIVTAGLRAPVLIITMAVLVTVASLFASAWPSPPRQPATQRTATTTDDRIDTLPALELLDRAGRTVALRGQLPAVILMIDGCPCRPLIDETVAAVRPDIAVITVSALRPSAGTVPPTGATPQAQGKTLRELRDPTNELRQQLRLADPDGTAAVILVDRGGAIIRTETRTVSITPLRADLARL